jgi:hypothetical protein
MSVNVIGRRPIMWMWWWMFPVMGIVMLVLCVGMMLLCMSRGCPCMHIDRQSRSSTPPR